MFLFKCQTCSLFSLFLEKGEKSLCSSTTILTYLLSVLLDIKNTYLFIYLFFFKQKLFCPYISIIEISEESGGKSGCPVSYVPSGWFGVSELADDLYSVCSE